MKRNNFEALGDATRAKMSARFFKTGKGEYGEGDRFLGITMPALRAYEKARAQERSIPLARTLLASPYHEKRMLGVIVLCELMKRADESLRKKIYRVYLQEIGRGINNWDLVDVSASRIVGALLTNASRQDLYTLAASSNLWKKRVAIIATAAFIQRNDFTDTLKLCKIFLSDPHDLMHKACGWMLREVGKRDLKTLRTFLKEHAGIMPRTMLRYAIERLTPSERAVWMKYKKA